MIVATPLRSGATSRSSTVSESPGSAPRTAIGPVAELIRSKSMSVTRSSSVLIWPVKQSFVSSLTTAPGLDLEHRLEVGPNDQMTWSRETVSTATVRRPCASSSVGAAAGSRLVVDEDPVGVVEARCVAR